MDEEVPINSEEKTTEIVVTGPPADAIGWATGEVLARKAWIKDYIAENMLETRLAPEPWAGRVELVNEVTKKWSDQGVTPIEAASLVDAAVLDMWAANKPDDRVIQKLQMFSRIRTLRQLTMRAITEGRREVTYTFDYLPHPTDPSKKIKRKTPTKEKEYKGLEMGHVRQLLAIEATLMELLGLAELDDGVRKSVIVGLMGSRWSEGGDEIGTTVPSGTGPGSSPASRAKSMTAEAIFADPAAAQRFLESANELTSQALPPTNGEPQVVTEVIGMDGKPAKRPRGRPKKIRPEATAPPTTPIASPSELDALLDKAR